LGFASRFAIHIGVDEALGRHGCTATWPIFSCSGPLLFEAEANHGSGNVLSLFLG
jgi:hypothetical protein